MYPASLESGTVSPKAMMRCAHAVPNKLVRASSPFSDARFTACRSTVSSSSRWTSQTQIENSRHKSWIEPLIRRSWPGQNSPGDTRELVGEGNRDFVRMHTTAKAIEPGAKAILVSIQVHEARACAMDQQPTNIGIAAFANAQQRWCAARRILSRHNAEPGCQVPAATELFTVTDRSYESGGAEWPDSGDAHEA